MGHIGYNDPWGSSSSYMEDPQDVLEELLGPVVHESGRRRDVIGASPVGRASSRRKATRKVRTSTPLPDRVPTPWELRERANAIRAQLGEQKAAEQLTIEREWLDKSDQRELSFVRAITADLIRSRDRFLEQRRREAYTEWLALP